MLITGVQWSGSHGCYVPSQAAQKSEPFSIAYTHPCEPYVIARKAALPKFDGRWRGRMLDKTAYVTHMAAWGFEFHVDPTSFMVHLPHASGVALKERPADDPGDQVFADFWALPYALTRVFLGDIRKQPEALCEVLPVVRPLKEEDVGRAMYEDGAQRPWCRDADVAEFDWARIEREFAAPHACTAGEQASCEGRSDVGTDRGSEVEHQQSKGGGDIADKTKMGLRGRLNQTQGKETMLWSAVGFGLLAWALFIWFYQSARRSSRSRRRFISMQLSSSSADLDQ